MTILASKVFRRRAYINADAWHAMDVSRTHSWQDHCIRRSVALPTREQYTLAQKLYCTSIYDRINYTTLKQATMRSAYSVRTIRRGVNVGFQ